jgi:hypothetical protein
MKTTMLAFSFCLRAGCATAATTDPGTVAQAQTGEPAELAGTWGFVLAASDVAAPLREKCAAASGGDASRAEACFDEIGREAAREKIRFTKSGDRFVWTSFETDGKKESVFVEMPLEIAPDGPGHVLAKVAGAPKGEHAARFERSSVNVMRIEVVDTKTIAMTDPKKGRLVYTKE